MIFFDSDNSSPNARFGTVMSAFMPHIHRRAAFTPDGLERDDIIQEGLIGLCDAVESYDESSQTPFRAYALTCIDNRINSALRAASRQKNLPLNDYSPLDDTTATELIDYSAEDIALAREDLRFMMRTIDSSLSRFEKNVLLLYLEGYNYESIGAMLSSTPKSVDNALQRARRKLKRSKPQL